MVVSAKYPSLQGRVILITGAGSGIGLACVRNLVLQNCWVAAADVDVRGLHSYADGLQEEEAERLLISRVDVTDADAVAEWVNRVQAEQGVVDCLVVSAGIEPEDDAAVHELPLEVWDRTFLVNVTGAFNACKSAMGAILDSGRGGSVVLIGSPTGHLGMELGHHAYSASKGGVFGLGRVMANQYATFGVRVNIVWPGLIDTPINRFLLGDSAALAREVAVIPQKRMGQASDIASMVSFLLSDDASYCTGGVFVVDGGLTAV